MANASSSRGVVEAKGGVSLVAKALALELAPSLVNVNAICPSDIMSLMFEGQACDYGSGDEEGCLRRLLTCYARGGEARLVKLDR